MCPIPATPPQHPGTPLTSPCSPCLSSGHLCNVSIQKWFRTAQRQQHPQIPPDLIWSCHQFQSYLEEVGQAGAWHEVMVPGMKAAVMGALRSTQHLVGARKSSFELYGADFLFGEDYQPWLLEINTSPSMEPCSAVTSQLCARVQRDTLRVVIDHKNDPACSTGAFELIYKEVGGKGVELWDKHQLRHPEPPLNPCFPVGSCAHAPVCGAEADSGRPLPEEASAGSGTIPGQTPQCCPHCPATCALQTPGQSYLWPSARTNAGQTSSSGTMEPPLPPQLCHHSTTAAPRLLC